MNKTLLWASVLVTIPMYAAAVENLPTATTWDNTQSILTVSWETQPQATTYGVCYGKLDATDAVNAQQEVDSKHITNASDCDNWRKVNGLQNGLTIKGMTVGNFYYVKTFSYSKRMPFAESQVILVETGSADSSVGRVAVTAAGTDPCPTRTDWSYRNMSRQNLSGRNLSCYYLIGTNLFYTNLYGADLRYANLIYADLRHANLTYADLRHADLRHANLRYANLWTSNLTGANLAGANLTGAILTDIKCDSTTTRPDGTKGCPTN